LHRRRRGGEAERQQCEDSTNTGDGGDRAGTDRQGELTDSVPHQPK
jgi:hypothetical protein